jgi:hypothetical protein
MAISSRSIRLIQKKRTVVGSNDLTLMEGRAKRLVGPAKKAIRRSGAGAETKPKKVVARKTTSFKTDPATGFLVLGR